MRGAILTGGVDALPVAQGGTGKTSLTDGAILVGKGTDAVQMISAGSGTGVLEVTTANGAPSFGIVPVALGGTGVQSRSLLSKALGLDEALSEAGDNVTYKPIPVTRGGTGVGSYSDLNTKLGLATAPNGNIADGAQISNAISVQRGGTGATNASGARTNLNVVNKTGDTISGDFILNGRFYIENTTSAPTVTRYDISSRLSDIESRLTTLEGKVT